jgi:hypothetical protein
VSAGGEGGIDWGNIGNPTTAQNLSGTNIDVDQVVASVGSVGVGGITATSFAAGAIDAVALDATAEAAIADAVLAETIPELTGDPGATPTLAEAVMLPFMAIRNARVTNSGAGTDTIANNAGSVILTATFTDAANVFTKGKYV